MDVERMRNLAKELVDIPYAEQCWNQYAIDKLREALHDLLGQWDGRDPETDGPIDLETNGACVRKAQAVLAEVE